MDSNQNAGHLSPDPAQFSNKRSGEVMDSNPFRSLPSVNDVLQCPTIHSLSDRHPHDVIVTAIRRQLDEARQRLSSGEIVDGQLGLDALARAVSERLEKEDRPKLRPVVNATGIVLHTNLGRAPVAEHAARAAYEAARGYLNLELDLETGKRSSRQLAIRDWVCRLTGAESATAVNNNAAATVIALRALCSGKEVIISRGQLIEIGGSFRIPEIMGVSGATLREVGTTNITRLADYEQAMGPNTGAVMHVHSSNYRVSGFTKSVSIADLVSLGKQHDLPVIDDIGSGALIDFGQFGFQGEPIARESITAGADLVLFSGDKLLGGPQAGILAGRRELIQRIERDPLMRAFRLDKMTLAALEATLRLYLNETRALEEVPGLRMLGMPLAELRDRAESLAEKLRSVGGLASVTVTEDSAYVGGGSLPDQAMKTYVVEVAASSLSEQELAHKLRTGTPAVVGRLQEGRLLFDVRTLLPGQGDLLVSAVKTALASPIRSDG
jgi:L-seryl-tRNA(Ser) seleniumtransferase